MIKILDYAGQTREELFAKTAAALDVSAPVADILANVKSRKDAAVLEYTAKFDGVVLESMTVTPEEIQEAWDDCDPEFLRILTKAADRIRAFHEKQKREGFVFDDKTGRVTGQRILPVEKAGIYVPGGTAAYPSTVLMDSIPAKIAGCKEVVMTTPPGKDGKVNPSVLCAAKAAGVDRIFKVGGAQAIAALAYGTETIPKVDKIVGPGNAFVAEAKKQVFGTVAIDMIAGPSEILIVADSTGDPAYLAADLLSQAEHDKNASAVMITDSKELAKRTAEEVEKQLRKLERCDIARTSIENNGKIILTKDLDEAVEVANLIAPEHLELMTEDAKERLNSIKNAGSVFLGKYTPEALGDYMAGPNHTLPTSGTARFSSALGVDDFLKKIQFICYEKEAFLEDAADIAHFAGKEGLTAHGLSALIRKEEEA